MDEQQKVLIRGLLGQLRALSDELKRLESQFAHYELTGAGPSPTSLPEINRQFNRVISWTQEMLQVSLPIQPLEENADRFSLGSAVRQAIGFIEAILGETGTAPKPPERREPLVRVREQKSPTEFTEVCVASAEEIKELIQSALPDWIRKFIRRAVTTREKQEETVTERAEAPAEESREPQTVRLTEEETPEHLEEAVERMREELEKFEDQVEDAADELEDVKEKLEEEMETGKRLTKEEIEARLRQEKARILHRLEERFQALKRTLEG